MNHIEQDYQCAVVQWAEWNRGKYPMLEYLFHIPNGGRRGKVEAAIFKRMGVKPGVPDLFLPYPTEHFKGLWIEMKSDKGKPTDNQKRWREYLTDQGYAYILAKSSQEAIEGIEIYLTLKG